MNKIEIFNDKKKEYRFRVKARNGKIIAQSEGYKTRQGAIKGIHSLEALYVIKDLTR